MLESIADDYPPLVENLLRTTEAFKETQFRLSRLQGLVKQIGGSVKRLGQCKKGIAAIGRELRDDRNVTLPSGIEVSSESADIGNSV